MGNVVQQVMQHRLELLFVGGIFLSLYLLNKEKREKNQLTKVIQGLIQSKKTGVKQFQNAMNQVYLKESTENTSVRNNSEHPIYKIAITGGPCAGKSTSLQKIHDDLSQKGFRVFSVPEIPTMVVHAGGMILMAKFNIQERIKFQSLLIRFQMYAEDYFTKLAEMSKSPAIVLCDRGTVDPAAYVSKEEFQAIMDEEGWSWVTLRDRRYDRVIFLSSAANGAQKYYTLQNNVARHQGLDVARMLDKKTLDAWTGHPHITVCPNISGQTFDQKLQRAIQSVRKTVGLQLSKNHYQKFLIAPPVFPEDIKVQISDIQQIFLVKDEEMYVEDKIKKRGQNNSYTYQRKYRGKQNEEGDYTQQIRKPLTSLQYVMLREEKIDKSYKVINRQRYSFVYKNIPYSIDFYENIYGQPKTYILRFANNNKEEKQTLIPDFLQKIQDVTKNSKYSLKGIAKA